MRGLTLELREREYVAAAKMRGESALYIMVVEILPNARGPLLVDMCLRMGYTIVLIGVLGFLGIGLPPPDPDWGGMVKDTYGMMSVWPHMALVPLRGDLLARDRLQPPRGRPPGDRACVTEPRQAAAARRPEPAPGGGPGAALAPRSPLLEFQDVRISYFPRAGEVTVIPGLSFTLGRRGPRAGGGVRLRQVDGRPRHHALPRAGRPGPGGRILFEGQDLATLDEDATPRGSAVGGSRWSTRTRWRA